MILDRKAKPWAYSCLAIFAIATVLYIVYARTHRGSVSGSTLPGLLFGAAGSLAIVIAMLLALRKRFRAMRIGRAYYWMQAHVWIGLLSYPLILFHAGGFVWHGPLASVLMWLLTIVYVAGIAGLLVQQSLPTKLLREVPAETIVEQMQQVLERLRAEAEAVMQPLLEQQRDHDLDVELTSGRLPGAAVATPALAAGRAVQDFYQAQIVRFLAEPFDSTLPLASDLSAQEAFHVLHTRVSPDLHLTLAKLQTVVDERRQLHRQRRLHLILHGWLLIHVPLSYALLILGAIHAVMAFRYSTP